MREILFRGQTEDDKWEYGYPYEIYRNCHTRKVIAQPPDAFGKGKYVEVVPETVGQFTGLTDKNGTKIFEGDILKQKTTTKFAEVSPFEWERYGVVRFGYHDWGDKNEAGYASEGWYIEPLRSVSVNPKNYGVGYIQSGLNQCDILNEYYPMEVIGNIHDNPELLKGGADNE